MYGRKTDVWAVAKAIGIILAIVMCLGVLGWGSWVQSEQCRQNPHPRCVAAAHWDEDECECRDQYGAEIEWSPEGGSGCGLYFLDE